VELEGGKRQISSTELKDVAEPGGVGGGGAEASGGSGSRAMWQKIAVVDVAGINVSWSKAG
jgi:hypothetical protein